VSWHHIIKGQARESPPYKNKSMDVVGITGSIPATNDKRKCRDCSPNNPAECMMADYRIIYQTEQSGKENGFN